jgi:hypothetical protein
MISHNLLQKEMCKYVASNPCAKCYNKDTCKELWEPSITKQQHVSQEIQVHNHCYNLDLEFPPKAHMLKDWSPTGGNTGRWWKQLREVTPSGSALELSIWSPASSLLSLLHGCCNVQNPDSGDGCTLLCVC